MPHNSHTGSGSPLTANGTSGAGVRRRENLKLQVNSVPPANAVFYQRHAQQVNGGLNHTVKPGVGSRHCAAAPIVVTTTSRDAVGVPSNSGPGSFKPVKKRKCVRCERQLGRFFNTGSSCPACREKICSSCRVYLYVPVGGKKKPWICLACAKERETLRKNPGDIFQRRNSLLRKNPLPLLIANEGLLTMPRNTKHSPVSNRVSYNGSLPRNFTTTTTDVALPMGDYYTATRGRPVATPNTPKVRKPAPPIPTFYVSSKPTGGDGQEVGKYQSATLGKPVKNLITPMAARRWEETAEVVTTMRRPKPSRPVTGYIKEKYMHVEVTSSSSHEARSSAAIGPRVSRQEGGEMHPSLLNGTGKQHQKMPTTKSATIDRIPLRRYTTSFSQETLPAPPNTVSRTPAQSVPPESTDLSAATLPRRSQTAQRNESLRSTTSPHALTNHPDQAISLLNLSQSSSGSPPSDLLTKAQPGLGHQAGLRHPSYSSFSRADRHRKSFIDRGSLRRSSSFKLNDFWYRDIYNEIAMEYDDFLTVVKVRMKEIAEHHLRTQRQQEEEVSSSGFNRQFSMRRSRNNLPRIPLGAPRRTSVPNATFVAPFENTGNPYDFLLTSGFTVSPDSTELRSPWTESDERFREYQKQREISASSSVVSLSLLDEANSQNRMPRKSSIESLSSASMSTSLADSDGPLHSALQRHVSIIEIKPLSRSGSLYSTDSGSVKNVFDVSDIVPQVEVVLSYSGSERSRKSSEVAVDQHEREIITKQAEPQLSSTIIEISQVPRDFSTLKPPIPTEISTKPESTVRIPDLISREEPIKIEKSSHFLKPIPNGLVDESQPVSPPVAFHKSPEPRPRKSLVNGTSPKTVNHDAKPEEETSHRHHLFGTHLHAAHSEVNAIMDGLPKLREVSKLPVLTHKAPKEDGVAEFQRVLGSLRTATKPTELARPPLRSSESEEEPGSEVQKVSAAIQHFKQVNEEVQDLKDFLRTVRDEPQIGTGSSLTGNDGGFKYRTPAAETQKLSKNEISANSNPFTIAATVYPTEIEPENAFLHARTVPQKEEEHEISLTEAAVSASLPRVIGTTSTAKTAAEENLPSETHKNILTTVNNHHRSPPSSLQLIQPEPLILNGKENHPPDRAKWRPLNSPDSRINHDVISPDLDDYSPIIEDRPLVPAKKCLPATSRPRFFSTGSTDSEDEDKGEFDFEDDDDSSHSVISDDGVAAVKSCRRAMPNHDDFDPADDLETWPVEVHPASIDFFGRPQVPLDAIEEESEDDDMRESLFTQTINRRAMRPAARTDLSPDDAEESGAEDHTWRLEDEENGRRSDLEQYFITGLLQPKNGLNGRSKHDDYRDDLDFDAMDEALLEEVIDVGKRKEPSIFGSAKLKFASNDYRLSSDMDDLSMSGPSDDESFY